MLLSVVALIFGTFLFQINASPTDYKLCPLGCNCSTNYVATCETLDFPSFTQEFVELRLVRLKKPMSIDSEFFAKRNLSSLTNLYIESTVINEIDPSAFQQDVRLNSIHFVNCTLPQLKPDTFLYATSLKLLNIDQCNLEHLVPLKSESIQQLKISFCKLKEVPEAIFDGLEELTDLNLQGNKIEYVDAASFKNVIFLSDLNLAYNNISKLPKNLFHENNELVSLDLTGNPLKKIDPEVYINLELLILSNCQLQEFKGGNFEDLENLDLSNNEITELTSDAFGKITNLEYLNISKNRLTSLPFDIFANNSRLSRIILDKNIFQRLPKFKNNEFMMTQFFSCNDCGLESIEADIFSHMPALITVHLSNNRISNVDSNVFSELKSLRVLDLSYNGIKNIDLNTFVHNTALKKLNLAGNNIPYLNPKMFLRNGVIETLDISNNGIQEIWRPNNENITIPSLGVLNLADNKLTAITVDDLEVVPNLKVLNLNNNIWDCNTNLKAAVRWLNMRVVLHSALGMSAELSIDQMMTYTDTYWNDLYTSTCEYTLDDGDEEIEDEDDDDEDEEEYTKIVYDDIEMKGLNDNWMIDNDGSEYYEDVSMNRIYSRDRYSFLWPLLVFMITALFVLFLVTNIILCILRKRGQLPRNINLSWKNGHSGFVYKPLTEDIARPRSIIITQLDKSQTPNL